MNETATANATATAVEIQPTEQGAPQARPQQQGGLSMMIPMLLIVAIFYFMVIRPQQRKEKERRKMIEELRVGAKVVFAGGIVGKIVQANEKTFRVETADGTEMEVLRSCVNGTVDAN